MIVEHSLSPADADLLYQLAEHGAQSTAYSDTADSGKRLVAQGFACYVLVGDDPTWLAATPSGRMMCETFGDGLQRAKDARDRRDGELWGSKY